MLEPRAFIDRLQSHARELRRSGRFRVVLELQRGLQKVELRELESTLQARPGMAGFVIPETLREMLGITYAFRLSWQHLGADPPGHPGVGAADLNLLDLLETSEEVGAELGLGWGQLRSLDRLGEHGQVVAWWPGPGEPLALAYQPADGEGAAPLGLSLEGYLEALLERRALLGWQAEFAAVPWLAEQGAVARRAREHLFPNGRVP